MRGSRDPERVHPGLAAQGNGCRDFQSWAESELPAFGLLEMQDTYYQLFIERGCEFQRALTSCKYVSGIGIWG